MTKLRFLPTLADLEGDWKRVRSLFQDAVEQAVKGEFAVEDIEALARSGHVLIGVIEEEEGREILMALALEIRRYPRMAVLNVMAMGGQRMAELFAAHSEEIARFARSVGITHFEAAGSRAVAKMLINCGWEFAYETVRYKL